MKKLTFETTTLLVLLFCLACLIVMGTFMIKVLSDEVSPTKGYIITQNNITYTGNIIRGDDYVKVIDRDGNMVIIDAAHGPISIRRSDLGN